MEEAVIELVASSTEAEAKATRAREEFGYRFQELTANILRIAAGAGSPLEILRQLAETFNALSDAIKARAGGEYQFLESQALSGILIETIEDWKASMPAATPKDFDRWLSDGSFELVLARDEIIRASLRIVAARLVGQLTQESLNETKLHKAIERQDEVRQRMRAQF